MNPATSPAPDRPTTDLRSALYATLPLVALTLVLFVTSYLIYLSYPGVGADHFPLWGLLITLGFIAAIGATVSGFFAVGPNELASPSERGAPAGPSSGPRRARVEFGRPVPEVSRNLAASVPTSGAATTTATAQASAEPWNEDLLPPVAPRGPRPVLTTLEDPGDIARALEEIADIQRQLSARRPPPTAHSETPARA
ncbi:MAG: hypothetical protein WB947_00060 [Thermoplasmata archaeon]